MPESKVPEGALGDPLVTVCGIALPSLFVQIIVVPARTVIEFGWYPMFISETAAFIPPPLGIVVGAAVGAAAGGA